MRLGYRLCPRSRSNCFGNSVRKEKEEGRIIYLPKGKHKEQKRLKPQGFNLFCFIKRFLLCKKLPSFAP
jgi:hypothetical protein